MRTDETESSETAAAGEADWDSMSADAPGGEPGSGRALGDPTLTVDVDGFEGPLDLLLELARRQKVDLAKISILALANQYLAFIEEVRKLRIEIAADYLVMAAWLAYLKSRLLLPADDNPDEEPSGEEMAALLAFRLQRLEAMREAGRRLVNRNRLGRDFFARGMTEAVNIETRPEYTANLYDLLTAYAALRQRRAVSQVTIMRRQVWSLQEARELISRFIGQMADWTPLDHFLVQYLPDPKLRTTALASSFAASLEMAREGLVSIRQEKAYAPIYMRAAAGRADQPETAAGN